MVSAKRFHIMAGIIPVCWSLSACSIYLFFEALGFDVLFERLLSYCGAKPSLCWSVVDTFTCVLIFILKNKMQFKANLISKLTNETN